MKFVISTQELNFLIGKCSNVIPTKATIPILANFLIEAFNNELVITATDLTVGIRCFTEAKILEEGAITVPAKRFAQLIRELTSINVEINTNANEVTEILADGSRFKLNGMNKGEFPSLPNTAGAMEFKIQQNELKNLLYRTAFAVSREDNRYVLTGVYMHVANGEATFAGTDGKRLARTRATIPIDPEFSGTYVIPLKAVEEIIKGLKDEGEATFYLMDDKIAVSTKDTMIITKLLTGDYPDVNRVIPEKSNTLVSLHREELMTLLRQVSLFTVDNNSVRFAFSDGELKLSANTMDIGEGKVSMPVNYRGEAMEIAFNPNFFLDVLRHTTQETVTMGITDSFNPGVITDTEPLTSASIARSLFVLMPMRLNEEQ